MSEANPDVFVERIFGATARVEECMLAAFESILGRHGCLSSVLLFLATSCSPSDSLFILKVSESVAGILEAYGRRKYWSANALSTSMSLTPISRNKWRSRVFSSATAFVATCMHCRRKLNSSQLALAIFTFQLLQVVLPPSARKALIITIPYAGSKQLRRQTSLVEWF